MIHPKNREHCLLPLRGCYVVRRSRKLLKSSLHPSTVRRILYTRVFTHTISWLSNWGYITLCKNKKNKTGRGHLYGFLRLGAQQKKRNKKNRASSWSAAFSLSTTPLMILYSGPLQLSPSSSPSTALFSFPFVDFAQRAIPWNPSKGKGGLYRKKGRGLSLSLHQPRQPEPRSLMP